MRIIKYYFPVISVLIMISCNKETDDNTQNLPDGATPYTEADIQFVPYTSGDRVFKRVPALDSTLTLQFKERIRTEEYFAWDQTWFTFSSNPELELELRLRYLKTENVSQKTLAIYMPYKDASGTYRTNLFEMPIDPTNLSTSFFQDIITFHDTVVYNNVEWYDVYEVSELLSTDPDKDGPQNFDKVCYNKVYGIIKMDQTNGNVWVLQQ
ncbi:MAG: hypothetical protein H6582_03910 [Crocinitomicaceae bacterium]|nr:hypothetical protein [Crocinitomicaceae bacterium]